MQQDIVWQTLYTTAAEHQRFTTSPDGSRHANGCVVGVVEDHPFRVEYHIALDAGWRVREVRVADLLRGKTVVHVQADGSGRWRDTVGTPLPQFDGCIDVDFTATPFTNTLPIRRLDWQVGTSHAIQVVYIVHPGFQIYPAAQTYTCLAISSSEARYHFKMDDFEQEITVDQDGFVIDYPELFERVWTANSF